MSDSSKTGAHAVTDAQSSDVSQKGVVFVEEPEHMISQEDITTPSPTLVAQSPKKHRASISGKKMTGRPSLQPNSSSTSLVAQLSNFKTDSLESLSGHTQDADDPTALLTQVFDWLQQEKQKRSTKHRGHSRDLGDEHSDATEEGSVKTETEGTDLALDRLEKILAGFNTASAAAKARLPSRKQSTNLLRRGSIGKKFKKGGITTSDTDAIDVVAEVPHVEASLDNSKTLIFNDGDSESQVSDKAKQKGQKHWNTFKQDIVRMTHTLRLHGWRRLPIDQASLIAVERLSGALTNAVYVVKPPKELSAPEKKDDSGPVVPRRKPQQLLLRIYGPQAGHLIDRERELNILRRLCAKNIGPKLLGYFTNGRFEEYLNATTLEPQDLRDPATSKQIAKRMRELHEGIELLEAERAGGPFVFMNWDKWVDRCEKVVTWLDQQVKDERCGKAPISKRYTKHGLVCGVEWHVFRDAYDRYRQKLVEESGGEKGIRKHLVFAHNDTQYGNLMRLNPPSQSPLLQPVNQHKQLVVIDFEYASANTPGLEFANHFTEWCYNYHHPELTWAINTNKYPSLQEQHRFVRAYVMHRPQFAASASSTPRFEGREKTNIPEFVLDARAPGGGYGVDYDVEERAREEAQEEDIQKLLHSTRLWRIANSALWIAWGIVQAQVPELDAQLQNSRIGSVIEKVKNKIHPQSDPLDPDVKEKHDEALHDRPEGREQEEARQEGDEEQPEDEFDYLAYSQDRAMFFWGDCIQMGIVNEEDLPEDTRSRIKYVKY